MEINLHQNGCRSITDFVDVIDRDGVIVLDVLCLLHVSLWLLECLDDQSDDERDDKDLGLTVLDDEAWRGDSFDDEACYWAVGIVSIGQLLVGEVERVWIS